MPNNTLGALQTGGGLSQMTPEEIAALNAKSAASGKRAPSTIEEAIAWSNDPAQALKIAQRDSGYKGTLEDAVAKAGPVSGDAGSSGIVARNMSAGSPAAKGVTVAPLPSAPPQGVQAENGYEQPGLWSNVKDTVGDLPLASDAYRSFTDPKGFVNDMLGFGDDGSEAAQTQLAKEVTAQSTGNAQSLYEQALLQAAIARGTPNAPQVVAGTIQAPAAIEESKYVTMAPVAQAGTSAQLMRGYDASQATAFDAAGRQQQAVVTKAQQVAPAAVSGVDTTIAAPQLSEAAQTGRVAVERVAAPNTGDALRGEQIAAARAISSAPSAAMSQFKGAQAQSLADQLSMAAKARGSERAGARREAIIQAGQQGAQAGLTASALAAQEEQAKRTAASSALSGIRTSDITTATTTAQIQAQQANLQAQLDAAIATGNTSAVNTIRTQQAQLEVEARKAEVSAGLTQQGTQAELERSNLAARQQTTLVNAGAENEASIDWTKAYNAAIAADAASKTQVSATNAAAQTQAARDLATATNTATATDVGAQTDVSKYNATLATQTAQANADRTKAIAEGNRTADITTQSANVGNKLAADTTTAGNTLTAQGQRLGAATDAINAGTSATSIQSKDAQTITDANKAGSAAESQEKGALIGAAGTALAAMSDERVKTEISPIGSGGPALDDLEERQRRNKFNEGRLRDTSAAFDYLSTSPSTPPTSRNRDWAEFYGRNAALSYDDMMAEYLAKKESERGGQLVAMSDERTKREVERMDDQEIGDWADAAAELPVTFRYKPGVEDGGKDAHLGWLAQDLERTGPIGRIAVHKDENGVREVDYGAACLMLSKAALDRANEALAAMTRGARR